MIVIRMSCSDNDVAKGYVICDEVSQYVKTERLALKNNAFFFCVFRAPLSVCVCIFGCVALPLLCTCTNDIMMVFSISDVPLHEEHCCLLPT